MQHVVVFAFEFEHHEEVDVANLEAQPHNKVKYKHQEKYGCTSACGWLEMQHYAFVEGQV